MNKNPTVSVAIVTARDNADTSYDTWRALRKTLLEGDEIPVPQKALNGEFVALLMACLNEPAEHHHVEYQLRALELQTQKPDSVTVISRVDWPALLEDGPPDVRWAPPMLSQVEMHENPVTALAPVFEVNRRNGVPLGCSDKNTAVVLCDSDILIVLDDCCLPSPGLVATAARVCAEGNVLLLGHRKINLEGEGGADSEGSYSESNWTPRFLDDDRNVFGIFAAPIEHILGVNGWNTSMDGFKGNLDVELKIRMDRYLKMRERKYVAHESARVYEIGHEFPWTSESRPDGWREDIVGYKAPGPSLTAIRTAVLEQLHLQALTYANQEAEANGEEEIDDEEDD